MPSSLERDNVSKHTTEIWNEICSFCSTINSKALLCNSVFVPFLYELDYYWHSLYCPGMKTTVNVALPVRWCACLLAAIISMSAGEFGSLSSLSMYLVTRLLPQLHRPHLRLCSLTWFSVECLRLCFFFIVFFCTESCDACLKDDMSQFLTQRINLAFKVVRRDTNVQDCDWSYDNIWCSSIFSPRLVAPSPTN